MLWCFCDEDAFYITRTTETTIKKRRVVKAHDHILQMRRLQSSVELVALKTKAGCLPWKQDAVSWHCGDT